MKAQLVAAVNLLTGPTGQRGWPPAARSSKATFAREAVAGLMAAVAGASLNADRVRLVAVSESGRVVVVSVEERLRDPWLPLFRDWPQAAEAMRPFYAALGRYLRGGVNWWWQRRAFYREMAQARENMEAIAWQPDELSLVAGCHCALYGLACRRDASYRFFANFALPFAVLLGIYPLVAGMAWHWPPALTALASAAPSLLVGAFRYGMSRQEATI